MCMRTRVMLLLLPPQPAVKTSTKRRTGSRKQVCASFWFGFRLCSIATYRFWLHSSVTS